MRHPTSSIVLALVLSFGLAVGVLAADSSWTPAIAKQLVSLGWEEPQVVGEQPTVVYALQFVQLDAHASRRLEIALEGSSEAADETGWRIVTDDELLRFVQRDGLAASLDAHGQSRAGQSGIILESWLVTVGQRPARLMVREENYTENGPTTEELDISLTPQHIDSQAHRILTRFFFHALSHEGMETTADTTLWATFSEPQLVAIASQRIVETWGSQYRHFALYLQGTVVPPERMPSGMDVVPVGNLRALQGLLGQSTPEWELPRFGLGVAMHVLGSTSHFGADMFQRTDRGHRLYAAVKWQGTAPLRYSVGLDLNLVEQLSLVARVDEDRSDTGRPALRLGLTEERRPTRNIKLIATALPISYIPGIGLTTEESMIQGELRYHRSGWDVFLGVAYAGKLQSTLGLGMHPTQDYGMELTYTHVPGEPNRLGARVHILAW